MAYRKRKDNKFDFQGFSDVLLYQEDLEYIMQVMEENDIKVLIHDSDFEYDTLEDLKENRGSAPAFFTISENDKNAFSGRIKIKFKGRNLTLSARNIDEENISNVYYKLKEKISNRRNARYRVLNAPLLFSLSIFFGVMSFFFVPQEANTYHYIIYSAPFLVLSSLAVILAFYDYVFYPAAVIEKRHKTGVVKRNSDKIIVSIITAIMTYIATEIADIFL